MNSYNAETLSLAADIAIWISVVVFALILVIMVYIFTLRFILIFGQYRRDRFINEWSQVLSSVIENKPVTLPGLAKSSLQYFLILWNTLHDVYKYSPDSRSRLNEVADELDLAEKAEELLFKRGLRRTFLGIMTLGNIGDDRRWQEISEHALSSNPMLSLVAVKALFIINPGAAISIFIYLAGYRDDWPRTMAASILNDAGPEIISQPMVTAIRKESDSRVEKLIPYLVCCDPALAREAARERLSSTGNDRIAGLCLKVLSKYGKAEDAVLVRQYCEHKRWHIRAQAARALGRVGAREDLVQLINLLNDSQWWVRYRAAQALASLPFIQSDALEKLRDEQRDRYGKDMLSHVLAEKAMAETHDPTEYF